MGKEGLAIPQFYTKTPDTYVLDWDHTCTDASLKPDFLDSYGEKLACKINRDPRSVIEYMNSFGLIGIGYQVFDSQGLNWETDEWSSTWASDKYSYVTNVARILMAKLTFDYLNMGDLSYQQKIAFLQNPDSHIKFINARKAMGLPYTPGDIFSFLNPIYIETRHESPPDPLREGVAEGFRELEDLQESNVVRVVISTSGNASRINEQYSVPFSILEMRKYKTDSTQESITIEPGIIIPIPKTVSVPLFDPVIQTRRIPSFEAYAKLLKDFYGSVDYRRIAAVLGNSGEFDLMPIVVLRQGIAEKGIDTSGCLRTILFITQYSALWERVYFSPNNVNADPRNNVVNNFGDAVYLMMKNDAVIHTKHEEWIEKTYPEELVAD